jgi:potassium-transporting ATPase KdpC subunit
MTSRSPLPRRASRVLLWILLGVLFLAPIAFNIYNYIARRGSGLPDEKTAIMQLLAQKFTGPGYFQTDESSAATPLSANRVYISATSAKAQLAKVSAERKLAAADITRLKDIIERMTEPSPSRAVGDERVNLLLLNLALDALQ